MSNLLSVSAKALRPRRPTLSGGSSGGQGGRRVGVESSKFNAENKIKWFNRLRAFRRAKVFRTMVCGIVELWFADLLFFCWFVGLFIACAHSAGPKFGQFCIGMVAWFCFVDLLTLLVFGAPNLGKSLKNHPNLVQNPSKINQKRPQIDENESLERFRHQIAPGSVPGRSGYDLPVETRSLFGRKWRSKGPVWTQLWSQIRQKSHVWV